MDENELASVSRLLRDALWASRPTIAERTSSLSITVDGTPYELLPEVRSQPVDMSIPRRELDRRREEVNDGTTKYGKHYRGFLFVEKEKPEGESSG